MITLDDGVLKIYKIKNGASGGAMPSDALQFKTAVRFSFSTFGVTRFYAAKQAGVEVNSVVDIYFDQNIKVNDVAVFENGQQARIGMIQTYREDGVLFQKLTLERMDFCYEITDSCNCPA